MKENDLSSEDDYLEGKRFAISDRSRQLYDSLHALDLTLDDGVEVFLLHLREAEEMDRTGIFVGAGWDEYSELLVDAFGQEGCV